MNVRGMHRLIQGSDFIVMKHTVDVVVRWKAETRTEFELVGEYPNFATRKHVSPGAWVIQTVGPADDSQRCYLATAGGSPFFSYDEAVALLTAYQVNAVLWVK